MSDLKTEAKMTAGMPPAPYPGACWCSDCKEWDDRRDGKSRHASHRLAHVPEPISRTAKHTAEEWIAEGQFVHTGFGTAPGVAFCAKDYEKRNGIGRSEAEANARRIVACVNACAGLSTEALESGDLELALAYATDCAAGQVNIGWARKRLSAVLAKLRGESRS